MQLLDTLLEPWRLPTPPSEAHTLLFLESLFVFALVWGAGGALTGPSQVRMPKRKQRKKRGGERENTKGKKKGKEEKS
jgi:hypothetical protein